MSVGAWTEWRRLPVSLTELCIKTTLRCGQTFRWTESADNEWSCALHGRILSLRQDPAHLSYRSYRATPVSRDDSEDLIRNYFNLDLNLSELYEQWASADQNFKKKALRFTGIRILRQDSWEALISFICSSNNNIARISQMVEKLCINYGPFIGHLGDKAYHDFPPPSALTSPEVEARLRELGFGYRAKYIYQTAVMVAKEGGAAWLDTLRNPDCPAFGAKTGSTSGPTLQGKEGYRNAHEKLLQLQGVGPKVADCVCLMGLGWREAVPVDTHVWQIAQRDYRFGGGKQKSLTKATYDAIGDHFRALWGKEAGWAHSVLFTADLKTFSDRLTAKIETEEKITVAASTNGDADAKTKVKAESVTRTKTTIKVKREAVDEQAGSFVSESGKVVPTRRSKRQRSSKT